MTESKTIAFFPEAAYGPALNSVGIAQACRDMGHEPVFLTDPGMGGVFEDYGFEEYEVNMSEPMPPEEKAKYWDDFINKHIPNFDLTPYEQIDNYVKECWEAIVETARWAQKDLPDVLEEVDPDLICVDNVILFPAVKQYDAPWVRILSCSENEIPDPEIPPYLSGCSAADTECFDRYESRFNEVIEPVHEEFNEFLADCGEDPYPLGQFFEASPHLNLLLYPEPLQWDRREPLDPDRFQYLEGCVREEDPYDVPAFEGMDDEPLLYLSFGSLGAGDTDLMKRLIEFLGTQPYRCLVNVGEYVDAYDRETLPDNVRIETWFPQPSVISQADVVIHHGGNNTTNECLYFGTPAIVMPYVWDGHDNATRVQETGHGFKQHRSEWTDEELAEKIDASLTDETIQSNVAAASEHMQAVAGQQKAARLLDALLEENV
ncbi:MAG: glycosyltransferase [Halobacteriota archaeon]